MRTPNSSDLFDDGRFNGDDLLRLYALLCLGGIGVFQIVEDWSSGEHYIVGLESADGSEIEVDEAAEEVLDSIAFRIGRELRHSLSEAAVRCDEEPGDGTYWTFPVSAMEDLWPELVEGSKALGLPS